jgi:hypothetical protein
MLLLNATYLITSLHNAAHPCPNICFSHAVAVVIAVSVVVAAMTAAVATEAVMAVLVGAAC